MWCHFFYSAYTYMYYLLLLSHSLCRSTPLPLIVSLYQSLVTNSLSLTLCLATLMRHLTPAEASQLPLYHLSDQCSLFHFTRHRPSEKGHVHCDNPLKQGPEAWDRLHLMDLRSDSPSVAPHLRLCGTSGVQAWVCERSTQH